MKKKLIVLLGIITVFACIGLTACGGGDTGETEATEQETTETEATEAEPTDEEALPYYSMYGYAGEDPVEGAVYEYVAKTISADYDAENLVSIPTVTIIEKTENEDGSVNVTGDFWIDNYEIDGTTLMSKSGGNHPGKMHLVKDEDGYTVESFEPVKDGGEFEPSAKEIFGDKYDEFMKVNGDSDARNKLRTETVANFVKANKLEVTEYKDEGWDPVKLSL